MAVEVVDRLPVFQGSPKVAQGAVRVSRVRCENPVIRDGIT
jgi:hypothetical protein